MSAPPGQRSGPPVTHPEGRPLAVEAPARKLNGPSLAQAAGVPAEAARRPVELPPTRAVVEALAAAIDPADPPGWAREPGSEAEFYAALVAKRLPGVEPVYDDHDRLVFFRGIGLRRAV